MTPGAYTPPGFESPIDLDLSRNEGITDGAALLGSIDDPDRAISRYPDLSTLRGELADLHGLPVESVFVTAGGDDALARCYMARVRSGREVVSTTPTFEMIALYAAQQSAHLVEVPWWEEPFPLGRVVDAVNESTDAVFLVSPNNPTGNTIGSSDLDEIADNTPFLVLDAAYTEFATEDLSPLALKHPNVVVVRTMSKAYGLAGLRVGYLLGAPELIEEISAFGNPYPVATLSSALALATLRRPRSEVAGYIAEVRRERAELIGLLTELGARPLPSEANFVLCRPPDPDWLVSAAASLGIALRRYPDKPGLEAVVRISLPGSPVAFARLVATLRAALAPEALLLDMDGVLADVSRSQTIAIIETARSFGVEIANPEIEEAKANGNANDDWELTTALIQGHGVEAALSEVTARYESLYQGGTDRPGLKTEETLLVDRSTLARWAQSRPLAVVTGRPRTDAKEFISRFDLEGVISALVTKDEAALKPDPEPVQLALELLGVGSAWMLGDTPDDVAAARGAGVVPIGVVAPGDDPQRSRAGLRGAARVLDRAMDVEEMLR